MTEPTIICPKCKTEIPLNESLAGPLIEAARKEFQQRLAQKETEIAADEAKKAKITFESELLRQDRIINELQRDRQDLDNKLSKATTAEVDFRRKERELNDKIREMDLAVEKRITQGLADVEAKARQRADEDNWLKLAEKDKIIADSRRQLEETKRKLEQGSQQLQGEVQELELEALLCGKFPMDTVEPVPKGEHGGDILHYVVGPLGRPCGMILWESKRAKNWMDNWLPKLRNDQRVANAEIAIIVAQKLPKNVDSFDFVDGVWITIPRYAILLANVLRYGLIEVAAVHQATEGQQTKRELIYQYFTGTRFRQRLEAMAEKFEDMRNDLDKERKAMTKNWDKREAQLRCIIDTTAGMYGDLQGIAGKTLQEIDGFDIGLLGSGEIDKSEFGRKCSNCHESGHNRATCKKEMHDG